MTCIHGWSFGLMVAVLFGIARFAASSIKSVMLSIFRSTLSSDSFFILICLIQTGLPFYLS